MKHAWVLLAIGIIVSSVRENANIVLNFRKFLKADCNSTGVICPNTFCRVRSFSRYQTFVEFGCLQYNGPMIPMLYSITVGVKSDKKQNFRQIFQFKNIDLCDLLNNSNKYPFLKDGIKNFNTGLPGIIQKCPYKMLKVYNGTFGPPSESHDKSVTDFRIFPNGIYKASLFVSDDPNEPKNTIAVNLFYESRFHFKNFETSI